MGPAVSYLERKGIQTNIGNLNRDLKAANSLMQSIRQMVRNLKGWLSGLKEKKAALLEALEQAKEPTIPELLSRYLDMRSEERTGWTSKGKLKGTVGDFNKVMEALDFLRQKEISTVESLDAYLDKVSGEILSAKTDIRKSERRIKAIDTTLSHIANHGAYCLTITICCAAGSGTIISNLTGMFDTLNTKVGEIAGEVGMTPSAWNSGIFNMVRNLSETVIVPIAGIVLTFVMCYELIQLIVEKNNLHDDVC